MNNESSAPGMTFSRFAIARPVTTTMFFIAIVLLGCVSYRELPVQLLPDVQFPGAMIFVRTRNNSLEDTLEKIVKPIEAIAAGTPRVREIESETGPGRGRVRLEFDFGTDMKFAILDLQDKVNQFRKTLPPRGTFVNVFPFDTAREQRFLMWMYVKGPDDRETLRAIAEDILQPQLESIEGVASVSTGGYFHDDIDVVFDRDKLLAHNLELGRVIQRIQTASAGKTSLGQVRSSREHYVVTMGEIVTGEDDLKRLPLDDAGIVHLSDVAHVFRNQRKSDFISRINGRNFVSVGISKDAEANILRLSRKIRQTLKELETQLPPGYSIEIDEDAGEIIQTIIDEVSNLAIVGGLLAMLVVVLFVRNLRMAAIVFTAIPISVITTFNLMYFWGLSLNILSLIGLALGIGMLLDNSIVVLENIFRHFERSRHGILASERATDEVWRALMATTMTNVVVFTPILFAEGELQLIFREGALAIIFPVAVSLLVALTLVPMLTSRILVGREHSKKVRLPQRIIRALGRLFQRCYPYWPAHLQRPRRLYREFYMMILRSSLRHRGRVILLTLFGFYATLHFCIPMIGQGTMQSRNEGEASFPVYIQIPRGSSYEQLTAVLDEVEKRIAKISEVERTRSWGEPEEGASVYVKLVSEKNRTRTLREVRETIVDQIGEVPGATLSLYRFESGSGENSGGPVHVAYGDGGVIQIRGVHWNALESITESLARQIDLVPGVANAQLARSRQAAEMQFKVDRRRSAMFNVSPQDIATYIETSEGHGQFSQITIERGGRKLDVRLRMGQPGKDPESFDEHQARPMSEIRTMEVVTRQGGSVPISEIGNFQKVRGDREIERTNMQFSANLVYMLEPRVDRKIVGEQIKAVIREARLPAGYSASLEGDERKIEENLAQLRWMLMVTLLLIYMVMASVFESLLTPLVILFALPFGAIGVFWGLALAEGGFDEMAMLGVVVLAGIVVNNGIVMLDFIMTLRRERRYRRMAAIITSCRARLRPILMTTLTTVLGLVPMAFRETEMFSWSNMAIVIIFGLLASTVLTLLVIPSLLIVFEDAVAVIKFVALWIWRWRWLLYFYRPKRMRAKRLKLAPAGVPEAFAPIFTSFMSRMIVGETIYDERVEDEMIAPGGLRRDLGSTAEIFHNKEERPQGPRLQKSEIVADRKTGIVVRNVHMVYPAFRLKKILHVIPSTRHKWGCRPVEGIEALRRVNLTVEPGMFGLVGPNGAGKTSLLKIITGLMTPTCGHVAVNEIDMARESGRGRREIGYLPQSFGLHGGLTARQYLDYYSLILGIESRATRDRNIAAVLDQVSLGDVADEPVGTFSGGMRQRVGIARLLLTVPRVLIVDEPTAGLDPIERVKFRILLSQLAQDRVVLLSTHIIDDISISCRRMAVLSAGTIVFEGTPAEIITSARGRVWEWTGRHEDERKVEGRYHLLYKRAAENGLVIYRFMAEACDLPGATLVEPSLEDAYIGLLAK